MNRGFTLIELLVVVLILGILAAVALPQYQKAVMKSRTAEAWGNLKTINTALKAYCLSGVAGGDFSTIRQDLDIDVKDSENFAYTGYVDCNGAYGYVNWYIYAEYQGAGEYDIKLGIHPTLGYRSCEGSDCKNIGFTKYGQAGCMCGTGSSCYIE